LQFGIEAEQLEKFLQANKRETRDNTTTNENESVLSSVADDAIPGMKDMGRQVDARLSKEAPMTNYSAVESILSSFEPV